VFHPSIAGDLYLRREAVLNCTKITKNDPALCYKMAYMPLSLD